MCSEKELTLNLSNGFVPLIIVVIVTLAIGAGVGGFLVLREKTFVSQEVKQNQQQLLEQPVVYSCPDRIEYGRDFQTRVVAKGVTRSVSADEQNWIEKNCRFNQQPGESAEPTSVQVKPSPSVTQQKESDPTSPVKPKISDIQKPLQLKVLSKNPYIEDHSEVAHCPQNISGIFTHHIVDIATIDHMVPLGHINPANKHVKPISHIYHSFKKEVGRVPVYMPADSLLVGLGTLKTPEGLLYNIEFVPCREIQVSMMDISEISDDLAKILEAKGGECGTGCWAEVNKQFKAGERIGKTTILDLGVYDQRSVTPFISPERYTYTMLHGVCPLDLFSDELKDSFYSKFSVGEWQRNTEPRCGSVAQDIYGTIQGEWFVGSASEQRWDYDVKVLSIIHGNYDPMPGIIAAVDTIVPSPSIVGFTPRHEGLINRESSEVRDSEIYCYYNEKEALIPKNFRDAIFSGTRLTGRIILQLIDAKTLKVEYQEKNCDEAFNFVSPTIYER